MINVDFEFKNLYHCKDEGLQHKIEQYKKMANSHAHGKVITQANERLADSLTLVIRTKKDADEFMAELEVAAKRK